MRMGVLDLFVLVVGICLAVLAVLALSTSLASARLSERQAASMQQMYDVDSAGQRFYALLDGEAQSLAGSGVAAADLMAALGDRLPALPEGAHSTLEAVRSQAKALGHDELASLLGKEAGDGSLAGYVGGVQCTLASPRGYELFCIFGIDGQGGCDVLQWRSTKAWDESAQSEQLWLG